VGLLSNLNSALKNLVFLLKMTNHLLLLVQLLHYLLVFTPNISILIFNFIAVLSQLLKLLLLLLNYPNVLLQNSLVRLYLLL